MDELNQDNVDVLLKALKRLVYEQANVELTITIALQEVETEQSSYGFILRENSELEQRIEELQERIEFFRLPEVRSSADELSLKEHLEKWTP